ncbi:MAG: SRPBCC family protein, partial [Chloroflexota bacterium]
MIKVETKVLIERPSDEVFAYISNFENNPKWQSGQIEARFTSEGPLGVGSTYDQVAKFLGRRIVSTFEVLEYEPNCKVKASSTSGSFPITFTRMAEPRGEGTEVTAIIEGDASGFFKLAEPLLKRMVQSSVDADYQNLKR